MSWFRRLGAGLSPRNPGLALDSVCLEFVGDKVTMGQVLFEFISFSLSV
jgi:hypothetical protein